MGPACCLWFKSVKPCQTIQTNLNSNFKLVQTLTDPEKTFPGSKKLEIKYGFEGSEGRNKFLHRNFFRLEIDFE
jgi:hypothetical protein